MMLARRIFPLRHRADLRALAFLLVLNVLVAVQWLDISRHRYLLLPTYMLAFAAVVIKHNHNHCLTFAGRGWNAGFELWLSVLTGQPTSGIVTVHNDLHHRHNNSEKDFVRCSLVRFRWNWLNLIAFPFVSVATMYRHKISDSKRWRVEKPALYRQAIMERAVTYLALVCLLVWKWSATLTYCVGPWLFAQWAIVSINLLQHQDCDFDSRFDHSRNWTGKMLNWCLFNNGFHTAHHLYPGAHWSQLPELHDRRVARHISPSLIETSLVASVWRRFVTAEDWRGSRK
jgi:fatty acid desaturase